MTAGKISTLIFMLFAVIVFCSACSNNIAKLRLKYEDGTELITITNYSNFHRMIDDTGIYFCGGVFYIASFPEAEYNINSVWNVDNANYLYTIGTCTKYTFSNQGYIPYCRYSQPDSETQYCIYDVHTDKNFIFNDMTELYEFLNQNKINVGAWYYGIYPENLVVQNGDWTVVSTDVGITAVKNNVEDIFSGKIDKYISDSNYIAFHIKITGSMESDLRAFENPVLIINDENIIDYTFLFDIPIYFDNYIVVDTNTDSYEIFNGKKDAEIYLSDRNVSLDWKEIK